MIDAAKLVQEEIKRALAPPPGFTIHNATDEDITITFDAEEMTIPAVDKIVYPHPIHPHVPCSAKDADGDWIPGTLVISNKVGDRGSPFNDKGDWLAAKAIKHCLDIDVTTGVAEGPYYKRGLTVIPSNPSKELVQQILADGLSRYESWRLVWAKETVEAYSDKASRWRSMNLQPQAPPLDYDVAKALLDRDYERRKKVVESKLGKANADILTPQSLPAQVTDKEAMKREIFSDLLNDPDKLEALLSKLKEAAKPAAKE